MIFLTIQKLLLIVIKSYLQLCLSQPLLVNILANKFLNLLSIFEEDILIVKSEVLPLVY